MMRLPKFLSLTNYKTLMKKQVWSSVFLGAYILIAWNAYGQGSATGGVEAPSAFGWPGHFKSLQGNPRFSAEAADLSISYYVPSAPTYSWLAPANWGAVAIVGFTERITLPSDSGFVDSVRIVFSAISGDSVGVVLDPDTILQTPVGLYHLDATIFNTSLNAFAQTTIYPSQLNGSNTVTVRFPHVQVPQNFHIGLVPSVSTSGFTSSYSILADTEVTRVRTTDNCHSTFIAVVESTGQAESGVVDSDLTPAGYPSPLYSNFYITAFVSSASSSVASNKSAASISVFPNPSSSFIQIQGVAEGSDIQLLDVLGRSVLSAQINGNDKLDVSKLQPGRYEAVLHSSKGVSTTPVIIQR
jgi:hypothetical protein